MFVLHLWAGAVVSAWDMLSNIFYLQTLFVVSYGVIPKLHTRSLQLGEIKEFIPGLTADLWWSWDYKIHRS